MRQGQTLRAVITQVSIDLLESNCRDNIKTTLSEGKLFPHLTWKVSLTEFTHSSQWGCRNTSSKSRTNLYLTFFSCFFLKKSSSLTHLLLPSPFKELSSSRFIFAESEFRVLGNKPTRDTFKRKTSSHFWHNARANKSLSEHFYSPPSFLAPAFLWAESHLSKFCSGNKEKKQYSYSTSC